MKYSELFKIYQECNYIGYKSPQKPSKSEIAKELFQLQSNDSSYLRFVSAIKTMENDVFYATHSHSKEGYCQFFRLNDIALSVIELIFWDYEKTPTWEEFLDSNVSGERIKKHDFTVYQDGVMYVLNTLIDGTLSDTILALDVFFNYLGIPMQDSLKNHLRF